MNLPESRQLNTTGLSHVFDNKSECYKLFWFQAITTKVREGKRTITFDELINEMIADAWYMVSEYHLNLGPTDNLEFVVEYIRKTTQMKPSEKRSVIIEFLKNTDDREVRNYKQKLISNVPYRLQSALMPEFKGDSWNCGQAKLAERINRHERLMYYFTEICGLKSVIAINPEWFEYLTENMLIIRGWIKYNMITYLQRRNPSVPGISDKLEPPAERKLSKVISYWKTIADIEPVWDIYGEELITRDNISIDHFVPWSYVAHDELWNLHPTTRSINSSKSNNLPDWDMYFGRLSNIEYMSYKLIWEYEKIHKAFDECAKDHINSADIKHKLYREGLDRYKFEQQLQDILYPVYCSARNCGFVEWRYK